MGCIEELVSRLQFVAVQTQTLTHMLHVLHCFVQLASGCFSKMTSTATHPECKTSRTTRIDLSYLVLLPITMMFDDVFFSIYLVASDA